jgi:uncharacterized protein YdaU (DUF1376 family)
VVQGYEGGVELMVMSALGLSPNDGNVPPISVRSPFLLGTTADYRLCRGTAMHYYQFNIADYRKDTGHLSTLEHGIYRQLLDWYYLDEKPIPLETHWVIRRLRLGSESDTDSLNNVLSEFFLKQEDGYHHTRCDAEISSYHDLKRKNKANGAKGGRPANPVNTPEKTQWVSSGLEVGIPNETQTKGNQELNNLETNIKTVSKKPESRKTSISGDFCITPELREWAARKGIGNLDDHLEPFIATCKANGYKYADWHCAFQKAVTGDWAKIGHGSKSARRFVPA